MSRSHVILDLGFPNQPHVLGVQPISSPSFNGLNIHNIHRASTIITHMIMRDYWENVSVNRLQ